MEGKDHLGHVLVCLSHKSRLFKVQEILLQSLEEKELQTKDETLQPQEYLVSLFLSAAQSNMFSMQAVGCCCAAACIFFLSHKVEFETDTKNGRCSI